MIRAAVFAEGTARLRQNTDIDALEGARRAEGTTWIHVTEATPAELERVAAVVGIHDLSLEDLRSDGRPKTEAFPEHLFTLVKNAELRRGEQRFDEEVETETVGLFIGDDWLVTLSQYAIEAADRIWNAAVEDETTRLVQASPDFLASRVLDRLVEDYFALLEAIETQIETIEEDVLASTEIDTLEGINSVRRDLLAFRKIAWPTREAANELARGDSPFVAESTEKYFRDVHDQLVQVVDLIQTYRDLASGARDIYLNTLSQSTNDVMKTLTVVATIFIPLTFVVGVYGMNFADTESTAGFLGVSLNMPELGWTFGYPAVMLGMALVGGLMLLHFKRRGWL